MSGERRELAKLLNQILNALSEEHTALLHSDGDKIAEIVEQKNKYVEELSHYTGMNDVREDENLMKLIKEINAKQETNLLLTRQALSFQEEMMNSIAENVSKLSNTYSSDGNYSPGEKINFVNQEV